MRTCLIGWSIVELFHLLLGLRINLSENVLVGVNVDVDGLGSLARDLGCKSGV